MLNSGNNLTEKQANLSIFSKDLLSVKNRFIILYSSFQVINLSINYAQDVLND